MLVDEGQDGCRARRAPVRQLMFATLSRLGSRSCRDPDGRIVRIVPIPTVRSPLKFCVGTAAMNGAPEETTEGHLVEELAGILWRSAACASPGPAPIATGLKTRFFAIAADCK
jgi:hypothetical protein